MHASPLRGLTFATWGGPLLVHFLSPLGRPFFGKVHLYELAEQFDRPLVVRTGGVLGVRAVRADPQIVARVVQAVSVPVVVDPS